MTIIEARTACNQDLQELRQYTAIDHEQIDKLYGRRGREPLKVIIDTKNPAEAYIAGKFIFGENCSRCPIWQQAGECALREQLQALAYEHRTKYERLNGINEASNEFRGFHKVRRDYEGSWGGGTPRNPRISDLNIG